MHYALGIDLEIPLPLTQRTLATAGARKGPFNLALQRLDLALPKQMLPRRNALQSRSIELSWSQGISR